MGLMIVSIIIFRDSIFYEDGFAIFGDFHFPLSAYMLNVNLYVWYENGMHSWGTWQLPRWIMLTAINSIIGDQIFIKLGLALAHFAPSLVGGLTIYYLLEQRGFLSSRANREITVFIAGLSYISAPIITNVGGVSFFSHSLPSEVMIGFPLFVYAVLTVNRLSFRSILLIACIVVIFGGSPREFVFYAIFALAAILVLVAINKRSAWNASFNLGKLMAVVLLLSAFAWLPYILHEEATTPYLYDSSSVSYESLKTFSNNQELTNAFRGLQKWWSIVDFSTENRLLYNSWFISSWLVPILALSAIVISKDMMIKKLAAILSSLFILILFLVKGINPPFGEFYSWLLLEAPLPMGINWIFREPSKFFLFLAFPVAFLLTITANRLINYFKRIEIRTVLAAAMIILIVLYAWPMYTGNFKDVYHLTSIPKEYQDVSHHLKDTDGNILWVPPQPQSSGTFVWSHVNLTPDPAIVLSPNPYFSMYGSQQEIWNNILYSLKQDYNETLHYLQRIGIKFIIIRQDKLDNSNDVKTTLEEFKSFIQNIRASEMYKGQYLELYQLPSNASYIYGYPVMKDNLDERVIIHQYDFTKQSDYDSWHNSTGISSHQQLKHSDGSLEASLWESSTGWKYIASPLIEITQRAYFIEMGLKLQNAHEVHLRVFEFDANRTLMRSEYLEGIGSGTTDWQLIKADYIPNDSVEYVQFQIWHGELTEQPLPNIVRINHFMIGYYQLNLDSFKQESLSYEKIDRTRYIVNVNSSSSPYVVVFPQSFNSLWYAKMDEKEYPSFPFYNSVNAFIVDKPGTIEILYRAQNSFYLGLVVSLLSLLFMFSFIIYRSVRGGIIRKT